MATVGAFCRNAAVGAGIQLAPNFARYLEIPTNFPRFSLDSRRFFSLLTLKSNPDGSYLQCDPATSSLIPSPGPGCYTRNPYHVSDIPR